MLSLFGVIVIQVCISSVAFYVTHNSSFVSIASLHLLHLISNYDLYFANEPGGAFGQSYSAFLTKILPSWSLSMFFLKLFCFFSFTLFYLFLSPFSQVHSHFFPSWGKLALFKLQVHLLYLMLASLGPTSWAAALQKRTQG